MEASTPIVETVEIPKSDYARLSTTAAYRAAALMVFGERSWLKYLAIIEIIIVVPAAIIWLIFNLSVSSVLAALMILIFPFVLYAATKSVVKKQLSGFPEVISLHLTLDSERVASKLLDIEGSGSWAGYTKWREYEQYFLLLRKGFPASFVPKLGLSTEAADFIRSKLSEFAGSSDSSEE